MKSRIIFVLIFFLLIDFTNGLNCVSCVGSINVGCNDPYNADTSGNIPVPYSTYCAKVVHPNYVERMTGGRQCTPGSGVDGSTVYCCSDKDYCNGTIQKYIPSIFIFLKLIIIQKLLI